MKRVNNTVTFTKTEIKRIIKAYTKEKFSLTHMSAAFGVSIFTIRKTLVDNGITIRGRGRPVTV